MYNKAQAQDSQHQLIERYAPLVKRIAYHLLARLPASVQVDDLIQAGMIGLLEASRSYDADQGASFETYASIRIRGSMIDEIRRGDWVPRSVHRRAREAARSGLLVFKFRHRVDALSVSNGTVDGVSGAILEPSSVERGKSSSRNVVGDFTLRAQAVIVASGGIGGTESDIRIQAQLILHMKQVMAELTAEQTGQSVETILEDNARDKWFTAQEALEYGFIDHIADRAASVTGGGGVRG